MLRSLVSKMSSKFFKDIPVQLDMFNEIREAIVQKIPEFYEIISQTGRGGQSDFISLIQK